MSDTSHGLAWCTPNTAFTPAHWAAKKTCRAEQAMQFKPNECWHCHMARAGGGIYGSGCDDLETRFDRSNHLVLGANCPIGKGGNTPPQPIYTERVPGIFFPRGLKRGQANLVNCFLLSIYQEYRIPCKKHTNWYGIKHNISGFRIMPIF